MGGLARAVAHGGDGQPLGINLAIAAPIPDLPLPLAALLQGAPHLPVVLRILASRGQLRRRGASDLLERVAGDLGEGRVDGDDPRLVIGDDHALAGIGEYRRVTLELALRLVQCFQARVQFLVGLCQLRGQAPTARHRRDQVDAQPQRHHEQQYPVTTGVLQRLVVGQCIVADQRVAQRMGRQFEDVVGDGIQRGLVGQDQIGMAEQDAQGFRRGGFQPRGDLA